MGDTVALMDNISIVILPGVKADSKTTSVVAILHFTCDLHEKDAYKVVFFMDSGTNWNYNCNYGCNKAQVKTDG